MLAHHGLHAEGIVVLALWLGGVLASWRFTFRWCVEDYQRELDEFGWSGFAATAAVATLAALVWPVLWSVVLVRSTCSPERLAQRLGGESRRSRAQRLERERAKQIAHIERLERELEVERRGGTTS